MKNLLAFFALCFCSMSARADLIYYESFNYADGPIQTVGSPFWLVQSGTGNDAFVHNHKLEVSSSTTAGSTSPARTDDVNRPMVSPYTNSAQVLYASFTINFTNLPLSNGTYFAHFLKNNTTFFGRVFALTGNRAGVSNVFFPAPNTFRLGVSGSGTGTTAVNKIFPIDLATNTDYQVVVSFDPVTLLAATLWINPLSSADTSIVTGDTVTSPGAQVAFGFRQAANFGGFLTVSNLAVATTFDEAATNVWSTNAVAPTIVYQPKAKTNFVGDSAFLFTVANGQGLKGLTYQWSKDGANYANPDGNTNVLTFPNAATSDSGNYSVVVTTPYGLSTTSSTAFFWVTNPPVPPTVSQQPSNTTVYQGQTATLKITASGVAPLTYQWYYNGSPATGPNVSGADTDTIVITDVRTNNGTTGTYRCDVSNPFGTTPSSNAVLSAISAPAVTIDFLHSQVDPTFYLPTNTTSLYTATGVVISHTNMTAPPNVQFYIQDGTGGITVFVAGGAAAGIQPDAGDNVTVTGPLGQFNSLIELNLTTADGAHSVVTNSHNNLIPPGVVLPLTFTNGVGYGGVSNVVHRFEGAYVTFTNVYFPDGFAGANFAAGGTYIMTNQFGDKFRLFMNAAMKNLDGLPIPPFAWTVSGPMGYFLSATAADRSAGFELDPTSYDEIVTNPPPPVTSSIAVSGTSVTITWQAQPYMSYSILLATDVSGPYVPIATGLTFNTTAGQYTDANAGPGPQFYRVTSP